MELNAFEVLIGLRLSIVRRAADMLVLHFGNIRAHSSGKGTVGDYALHVQCPWRLDGPLIGSSSRLIPAPESETSPLLLSQAARQRRSDAPHSRSMMPAIALMRVRT
jgi:hypothetical protein